MTIRSLLLVCIVFFQPPPVDGMWLWVPYLGDCAPWGGALSHIPPHSVVKLYELALWRIFAMKTAYSDSIWYTQEEWTSHSVSIPYRYVFCWNFWSQCQLSNAGRMRAEFLALGFLSHLAARIRIMNEIIKISQPAPSSCQERIMNVPIGAVHSDKE